jgi:long-chain acyl-CoA synthetase
VRYWNAPAATAEVLRDGWLDTGDIMRVDADGYFWFRGRQKQLIIHDGSNIAPQEVEEALLAHPAVESAGVVGIHHPLHGETVRAYVSLRDGAARPTPQALIDFARTRIAAYKAPEEIVFLPALPLNATGKVDRVQLKRLAAA